MKKPSNNLFDLVKSLTKSEKRYIKVQSGSGKRDYIQLMDALDAQTTFNEESLAKDHIDANFTKHLAVNKRYLYELILKSLTQFDQKTIENKIYEKIDAANVLIRKGLFRAAYSEIIKGQKMAQKYELFDLLIVMGGIQKKILSQHQFKKRKEDDILFLYSQEKDCLEQIKNTNDYWHLTQQVALLQQQQQQQQQQQEQLLKFAQTPSLLNPSSATNFKSKLYFFQANAVCHFMLGNVKQANELNWSLLDLFDANPHFLRVYAKTYLATLNNTLIDSLITGNYDKLNEGIIRMDKDMLRPEFKSIKGIEVWVFRQRYILLLNWSLGQKNFENAMKLIPEIEDGLKVYGKKIEQHYRITFYYLIAYISFINKDLDRAIKWNNLILDERKEKVAKEIFCFARVLNLLIHYELRNYTLLESLLLSTPKYLKARRAIYETEITLFQFLRKMINATNKKEKNKLIQYFESEVNNLSQLPNERRVFEYLDLRYWLKS